jgi:hypothetical protein
MLLLSTARERTVYPGRQVHQSERSQADSSLKPARSKTIEKPGSQRSLREAVDQFKVEDFPVDDHSSPFQRRLDSRRLPLTLGALECRIAQLLTNASWRRRVQRRSDSS